MMDPIIPSLKMPPLPAEILSRIAFYLDGDSLGKFERVTSSYRQPDFVWKYKVIQELISNPNEEKLLIEFSYIKKAYQSLFIRALTSGLSSKLAPKNSVVGVMQTVKPILEHAEVLLANNYTYKSIYYFLRMMEKTINKKFHPHLVMMAFEFGMDLWVERLIKLHDLNLNQRFDRNWQLAQDGWSYLHKAVVERSIEVAAMLLRNGLDINYQFNQVSALFLAVIFTNIDFVKFLLDHHADANLANKNDKTPLIKAIQLDKPELFTLLYDYTTETPFSELKLNLLQVAAHAGAKQCLELLLKLKKYNIDAPDEKGSTALHHAVKQNQAECVWILRKHNASINILNNDHSSPVGLAQNVNNHAMVHLLTQPVPDQFEKPINVYAKFIIQNLTKEKLCQAFTAGSEVHLNGFSNNIPNQYGALGAVFKNQFVNTTLIKNYATFGFTFFMKKGKTFLRIPFFDDITDENAKQILLNFLNGPGREHADTLKYQVITNLLSLEVTNTDHKEASLLINLIKEYLRTEIDLQKEKDKAAENAPKCERLN